MNRPCKWPGCPAIVARGVRYCLAHAQRGQHRQAEEVQQYDRNRDPRAVAFYRSAAWLSMRRQVLCDQPVCADCGRRFSHHVDHVVPLLVDWQRRLDRANLRGLCQPCHTVKTGRDRGVTGPTRHVRPADRPTTVRPASTPQIGHEVDATV
jgi:5-methylcytosine-specific restriction protein A